MRTTTRAPIYQFLAETFPTSKEAHIARLRLRQGFPALHPEPPVSPTPNPYAPCGARRHPPLRAREASLTPSAAPAATPPAASPLRATPTVAPSSTPSPASSVKPAAKTP